MRFMILVTTVFALASCGGGGGGGGGGGSSTAPSTGGGAATPLSTDLTKFTMRGRVNSTAPGTQVIVNGQRATILNDTWETQVPSDGRTTVVKVQMLVNGVQTDYHEVTIERSSATSF